MSKAASVFVKNLPTAFTGDDLHKAFQSFGEIEFACMHRDALTRANLGTGVVAFKSALSAEICRDVLGSQAVVLDPLRGRLQILDDSSKNTLLVQGLPLLDRQVQSKLVEIFQVFDAVLSVKLVHPASALVTFTSATKARRAMQTVNWQGVQLGHSTLRVCFAHQNIFSRDL